MKYWILGENQAPDDREIVSQRRWRETWPYFAMGDPFDTFAEAKRAIRAEIDAHLEVLRSEKRKLAGLRASDVEDYDDKGGNR